MPSSTGPDLLPGTLDLMILKTLSLGPNHGYAVARRIRQVSDEVLQVEEGSLYPALHRLERRGLLRSEWRRSEANRRAKYYQLTRAGRASLSQQSARWRDLSTAIGKVLTAERLGPLTTGA